jgi:hypothetical protein
MQRFDTRHTGILFTIAGSNMFWTLNLVSHFDIVVVIKLTRRIGKESFGGLFANSKQKSRPRRGQILMDII